MEQVVNEEVPEEPPEDLPLLPCHVCHRTFLPQPLKKHIRICEQVSHKKRKPFDSLKQRVEGTDIAPFHQKSCLRRNYYQDKSSQYLAGGVYGNNKQSKWKEKHLELVNTIRQAKEASPRMEAVTTPTASKKGVHGTSSISLLNERCPTCDRAFGPKAFDRHVEWCRERKTRVQQSPADVLQAKERLEARIKYRVPPLRQSKRSRVREKYSPPSQSSPLLHRANTIASVKSTPALVSKTGSNVLNAKTTKKTNTNKAEKSSVQEKKEQPLNTGRSTKIDKTMGDFVEAKEVTKTGKSFVSKRTFPAKKINDVSVNNSLQALKISSLCPGKKNKPATWRDVNETTPIGVTTAVEQEAEPQKAGKTQCRDQTTERKMGGNEKVLIETLQSKKDALYRKIREQKECLEKLKEARQQHSEEKSDFLGGGSTPTSKATFLNSKKKGNFKSEVMVPKKVFHLVEKETSQGMLKKSLINDKLLSQKLNKKTSVTQKKLNNPHKNKSEEISHIDDNSDTIDDIKNIFRESDSTPSNDNSASNVTEPSIGINLDASHEEIEELTKDFTTQVEGVSKEDYMLNDEELKEKIRKLLSKVTEEKQQMRLIESSKGLTVGNGGKVHLNLGAFCDENLSCNAEDSDSLSLKSYVSRVYLRDDGNKDVEVWNEKIDRLEENVNKKASVAFSSTSPTNNLQENSKVCVKRRYLANKNTSSTVKSGQLKVWKRRKKQSRCIRCLIRNIKRRKRYNARYYYSLANHVQSSLEQNVDSLENSSIDDSLQIYEESYDTENKDIQTTTSIPSSRYIKYIFGEKVNNIVDTVSENDMYTKYISFNRNLLHETVSEPRIQIAEFSLRTDLEPIPMKKRKLSATYCVDIETSSPYDQRRDAMIDLKENIKKIKCKKKEIEEPPLILDYDNARMGRKMNMDVLYVNSVFSMIFTPERSEEWDWGTDNQEFIQEIDDDDVLSCWEMARDEPSEYPEPSKYSEQYQCDPKSDFSSRKKSTTEVSQFTYESLMTILPDNRSVSCENLNSSSMSVKPREEQEEEERKLPYLTELYHTRQINESNQLLQKMVSENKQLAGKKMENVEEKKPKTTLPRIPQLIRPPKVINQGLPPKARNDVKLPAINEKTCRSQQISKWTIVDDTSVGSEDSPQKLNKAFRDDKGEKKKKKKETGVVGSKTNKQVKSDASKNVKNKSKDHQEHLPKEQTTNVVNEIFRAEDLFSVDDETYEEYKKYEEMYLKEKNDKYSYRKHRKKPADFGIDINGKTDTVGGSLTEESITKEIKKSGGFADLPAKTEEKTKYPSLVAGDKNLPKFCHECGHKYPVTSAKFCVECGVRRLVL